MGEILLLILHFPVPYSSLIMNNNSTISFTVNKEFFDPLMLEHALTTLLETMGVNVIESSVDNITEEENEEFMNKMCQ